MLTTLRRWSTFAAIVLLAAAAAVVAWLYRPLPLRPADAAVVDVVIEPGMSAQRIAQVLVDAGVDTSPIWLSAWLRLSLQARSIKAGSYEIVLGTTPMALLNQLVRGHQAMRRLTLIEGWNLRQVLQAVRTADGLIDDLPPGDDPVRLAQHLGLSATHAEGRFFPDTYVYPKRTRASVVLRQAAQAMQRQLSESWEQRSPAAAALRTPDELLILASIIEKETGLDADRARIAAVFHNRLRLGMRLQSDPTVIYGLGASFDGNLRRIDLVTDTPYNTYTRAGLPPTPIAMPGRASLLAAAQPAPTRDLYFVARGDGSSAFSHTLKEHNRAVQRYQLGR